MDPIRHHRQCHCTPFGQSSMYHSGLGNHQHQRQMRYHQIYLRPYRSIVWGLEGMHREGRTNHLRRHQGNQWSRFAKNLLPWLDKHPARQHHFVILQAMKDFDRSMYHWPSYLHNRLHQSLTIVSNRLQRHRLRLPVATSHLGRSNHPHRNRDIQFGQVSRSLLEWGIHQDSNLLCCLRTHLHQYRPIV